VFLPLLNGVFLLIILLFRLESVNIRLAFKESLTVQCNYSLLFKICESHETKTLRPTFEQFLMRCKRKKEISYVFSQDSKCNIG